MTSSLPWPGPSPEKASRLKDTFLSRAANEQGGRNIRETEMIEGTADIERGAANSAESLIISQDESEKWMLPCNGGVV